MENAVNTRPCRIFAVIPAAGRSRRMGRPKLLLPWEGRTVMAHLIETLRSSPAIELVAVVVRPDDEALRTEAARAGAVVLVPDAPPPEMRSSVEFALRFIEREKNPDRGDAWLLCPADHPLFDQRVLERLLARWSLQDAPILVPTFEGQRGHPVLFRWSLAAEVYALPNDAGLNQLLRQHAGDVAELETGSPAVIADLDTPEDYARLLASHGK